jgi:CBS domain-containing protein
MKRIGAVMVRDVVAIDPSASVLDAANRMREANVGLLPIVENGQLRAVLTDRDLVVRALARRADPRATAAIECATREPTTAQPDWDVDEALHVMARDQIGRLPVVDDDGQLVGVVTFGSILLRGEQDREAVDAARHVSRRAARRPETSAAPSPAAPLGRRSDGGPRRPRRARRSARRS